MKTFFSLRESTKLNEGGIETPKRTTPFGNPPPGTIAHDQMMGKYKQLRKAQKEREAKKEKVEEQVKTTHEDPLVTVHQDGELHTHANLSTANSIFNTNVKHTDVHKGPVTVTSGREDKKKLKFALSMHHAAAMKEETELQEGDYSVTVSHRLEGKTTKHEYTVKNAQSPRHAKHIAMQKHEKKIGPLKPGEQFSASNMDVKEI
jgi:hypothetical protein